MQFLRTLADKSSKDHVQARRAASEFAAQGDLSPLAEAPAQHRRPLGVVGRTQRLRGVARDGGASTRCWSVALRPMRLLTDGLRGYILSAQCNQQLSGAFSKVPF